MYRGPPVAGPLNVVVFVYSRPASRRFVFQDRLTDNFINGRHAREQGIQATLAKDSCPMIKLAETPERARIAAKLGGKDRH